MTTALVRTWGDGLTVRPRHVVADIDYAPDMSWLTCSCLAHFEAATPDSLAEAWRAHGGKVLDVSVPDEPPTAIDDGVAVLQLLGWRSRCSCDTTPITECPNYMSGDELLDEVNL